MAATGKPSLNALRAFEAAGRHLSFQAAAAELHVTPAALSHQIRQLESRLGQPLFERHNRAVSLTAAGAQLLPEMRDAFGTIDRALERLAARGDGQTLTVTTGPSFAAKWLAPRLREFLAEMPDVDFRLSASLSLVDLRRQGVDVAIRFGTGHWPGHRVSTLIEDQVTPMCSPLWLADNPIETPADLLTQPLIDDVTHLNDLKLPQWEDWLRAAGVRRKPRGKRLAFNVADHTLDAAAAGSGVTLGRTVLAQHELLTGRLVRPFALCLPTGFAFRAIVREERADDPLIAAFVQWLGDALAAGERELRAQADNRPAD